MIRNFSTVVKPAQIIKVPKEKPFITCKNPKFNFNLSQIPHGHTKFKSLPLASSGWFHRKSKGDFFIIHPTKYENDECEKTYHISSLNSIIGPILIENLKRELDIENLTYIQENGIKKVKDGNHILIAAETGCGKTLAYAAPIVQRLLEIKPKIKPRKFNTPLMLVLTPGRELATQISNVFEKLVKNTDLTVKSILGGNTKKQMMNPDFEDIDILVGTIGAVSKLVTTGIYRMDQVRHLILDEADTLLDDSFSAKLNIFLKKFPFYKIYSNESTNINTVGTQLILVSATMPINLKELLISIIDTETIDEVVSPNLHKLLPHIQQKFLRMNKSDRPSNLITLVKSEINKHRPLLIFANKSNTSDFISIFLNEAGVNCINLNGDMLMKIRAGRFEQFQDGNVDVLATTDVASRGLDTRRARHVVNFDFPLHVSDYIHRCGRVGRVGSYDNCFVTNFISGRQEIDSVQRIEHAARTGGTLPNVNANITGIIHKKILKGLGEDQDIF